MPTWPKRREMTKERALRIDLTNPIVVDEHNRLLDGVVRVQAAKFLGIDELEFIAPEWL